MVVKHLNPKGWRGGEGGGARHLVEPIEQLKRGCFALLARHNEAACGRHVYSREEWERRKRWEGKSEKERGSEMTTNLCVYRAKAKMRR